MGQGKPPQNTMEFGHTVLPQYLGMHSTIADPRPNPRTRRCMSEEDDPARAAFVEKLKAKYWKEEE